MITLRARPEDKIIELGGGANPVVRPNVDVRMCYDQQGNPTVDFTADFEKELPITSQEWDGVFSHFVIEHLSWRKVRLFISEMFRILKPGGKVVVITANTEAQLKWISNKMFVSDDKRDEFDACSCILFGDQDYPENAHKNYLSPEIVTKLFSQAGFTNIVIQPYGELATDMVVEGVRPVESIIPPLVTPPKLGELPELMNNKEVANSDPVVLPSPEKLFDRKYFDGGNQYGGYKHGYADFPCHEVTLAHILNRKPESVLELGCGRGYLVKKLQDRGIPAYGLDISKHCNMTRVYSGVTLFDARKSWVIFTNPVDLCFSIAFLDHVPESDLPAIVANMRTYSKRGLHGINFNPVDPSDRTRVTIRPKEWWQSILPLGHEVVSKDELESGSFPEEVIKGDGKVKLNIGSFTTMFHHGWVNIDIHDLANFAGTNGYKYQRHDVRQGLPYQTSSVDLIYHCHMLEHLTYEEGLTFLRECRRVLNLNGAMRIIVPDAEGIMEIYHGGNMAEFDELNEGCSKAKTQLEKMWNILYSGHSSAYDYSTLSSKLDDSGFYGCLASFRQTDVSQVRQILRETLDMLPSISLYMDATPKVVERKP